MVLKEGMSSDVGVFSNAILVCGCRSKVLVSRLGLLFHGLSMVFRMEKDWCRDISISVKFGWSDVAS